MKTVLRYSERTFPPYRFIPGESPHPTENPKGHSYGQDEVIIEEVNPEDWQNNGQYLFGVDLYNAGFWWESHEAFESLWRAVESRSSCRDFLQGLIKASGAFLKWHLKKKRGFDYLYQGAIEHLKRVESEYPFYMGIGLTEHIHKIEEHFSGAVNNGVWKDLSKNYPFILLEMPARKSRTCD